jgi:hypothetical protein
MKSIKKSSRINRRQFSGGTEFLAPGIVIMSSTVEIAADASNGQSGSSMEDHFKVILNHEIIGWLVLCHINGNIARLKTRFLCEQVDSQLLTRLYAHIENHASEKGYKLLIVHATPSGKGFFQSLGYEEQHQEVTESGVIMHKMKKKVGKV